MIKYDLLNFVGNTPLIKVVDEEKNNNIFIKLEGNNPSGSIKDRVFKYYLLDMIKKNKLNDNSVLCIPSSGNSSISLATLAISLGYKVRCYMPSSTTIERRIILSIIGAEQIFVEQGGMEACLKAIKKDCKLNSNFVFVDQFYNKALFKCHKDTVREITKQLSKDYKIENLDYFVSGVGTGITIKGISTFLLNKYKDLKVVAFEPNESRGLTMSEFKPHSIEGVMPNFVTQNYKDTNVYKVFSLTKDEVFSFSKKMIRRGLHLGITSLANLLTATKIEDSNKNILIISYDNYDKYLEVLNNYEEK